MDECFGCYYCVPKGIYPTPPPSPPPACSKKHCRRLDELWAIKCTWSECKGCAQCAAASPPPPSADAGARGSPIKPHVLPLDDNFGAAWSTPVALAWSDEFEHCEADGFPDRNTWQHEWGYVRNGEPQFYEDSSIRCDPRQGTLRITAREHPGGIPSPDLSWNPNAVPVTITSGSITTRQEATGLLLHGQYDARIRFDLAANAWPAWWAIGSNTGHSGAWPRNGEIDMFEYRHGHVWAQLAYDGCRGACWSPDPHSMGIEGNGRSINFYEGPWGKGGPAAFERNFHEISMVWTESSIDFFFDGVHTGRSVVSAIPRPWGSINPYTGDAFGKPNEAGEPADDPLLPLLMKLNLAVAVPKAWLGTHLEYQDSRWPISMEVDYVRYWSLIKPPPPSPLPMRPPFPPGARAPLPPPPGPPPRPPALPFPPCPPPSPPPAGPSPPSPPPEGPSPPEQPRPSPLPAPPLPQMASPPKPAEQQQHASAEHQHVSTRPPLGAAEPAPPALVSRGPAASPSARVPLAAAHTTDPHHVHATHTKGTHESLAARTGTGTGTGDVHGPAPRPATADTLDLSLLLWGLNGLLVVGLALFCYSRGEFARIRGKGGPAYRRPAKAKPNTAAAASTKGGSPGRSCTDGGRAASAAVDMMSHTTEQNGGSC